MVETNDFRGRLPTSKIFGGNSVNQRYIYTHGHQEFNLNGIRPSFKVGTRSPAWLDGSQS